MTDLDPLPDDPTWPQIIEFEINKRTGGDATVGEIVALMIELGWLEPKVPERAYGALRPGAPPSVS